LQVLSTSAQQRDQAETEQDRRHAQSSHVSPLCRKTPFAAASLAAANLQVKTVRMGITLSARNLVALWILGYIAQATICR
jgi:hypothetical protein